MLTKRLVVLVTPKLLRLLKQEAKQDGESVGETCRQLLVEGMKARDTIYGVLGNTSVASVTTTQQAAWKAGSLRVPKAGRALKSPLSEAR